MEAKILPFLKNKDKAAPGITVKTRTPDEQPEPEENDDSAAINACSQALIDAVHSNNVDAVSDALKDAFTILDSQPHEEGEHISKHDYDAQKE